MKQTIGIGTSLAWIGTRKKVAVGRKYRAMESSPQPTPPACLTAGGAIGFKELFSEQFVLRLFAFLDVAAVHVFLGQDTDHPAVLVDHREIVGPELQEVVEDRLAPGSGREAGLDQLRERGDRRLGVERRSIGLRGLDG